MKRFDYYDPQALQECLEILGGNTGAIPLAGGTDLIPRLKSTANPATALVSLRRIEELKRISANGTLAIGATTTLAEILQAAQGHNIPAAILDAAACIGSVQIRNAATLGGNVCNAAPSADTAPALLVLGGRAIIADCTGERTMALSDFFAAPGVTALVPGELLTRIEISSRRPGWGSCYMRHTPRSRMDLAVVGVAVALQVEGASIADASIALGAVAPTPMLAQEAAERLIGQDPALKCVEEAAALAAAACSPIDDVRATADYRRHLVSVLVQYAVGTAYARARADEKGAL